jgi:N-acetyl-gamma-glutamyl-phosphate reductase
MSQVKKIKAGIIGGAGYTGGELIRILINHPEVEIAYVLSKSQAGKLLSDVHPDLTGDTTLSFSSELADADVVFLCVQHGESKKYLEAHPILLKSKIIDLSRDFRIKNNSGPGFVYGLPELNKTAIQKANYIANPGCFATAIQLGLLPLAEKGLLNEAINVTATTGSTGAGQSLSATTHYSWRHSNLSVYQAFGHAHVPEINQSLSQLQSSYTSSLNFIPQRGSFTRGILAVSQITCSLSQQEIIDLYKAYYAAHPFVHILNEVDVKQVVNTNKCFIQLIKQQDQLAIVSVIDNLLKGASGQAVQNMNLLFGLDETTGLKLKALLF